MTTRLGATTVEAGTRFEVWAPVAARVEIVAEASGAAFDLTSTVDPDVAGRTTWIGVLDEIGAGDRYRVRLDGGELRPDPASRWQPDGVHRSVRGGRRRSVRVARRRLDRGVAGRRRTVRVARRHVHARGHVRRRDRAAPAPPTSG
ncbi:MAG: hypothetical protein WKF60_10390 [Ilumatobacter sp.]